MAPVLHVRFIGDDIVVVVLVVFVVVVVVVVVRFFAESALTNAKHHACIDKQVAAVLTAIGRIAAAIYRIALCLSTAYEHALRRCV